MKALIIGAAGFVGGYLIDELAENLHWEVFATKLAHEKIDTKSAEIIDLDILCERDIFDVLSKVQPDIIYHLAAQSSVAVSWQKPAVTAEINIKGAINLLEAVRKSAKKSRVVLIGSSEEYGAVSENDCPISENYPPNPNNIYAVTKLAQNRLGGLYARSYGLDTVMVRAFNHIGAKQSPQFVVSDFCKQVAEIEAKKRPPIIYVGNLSAKRDFTDVRDIVRAYGLLGTKGKSGETYNVGSGKAVAISEILGEILKLSSAEIEVKVDEKKFRPVDVPIIAADVSKIFADTGWKAEIGVTETLGEVLDYFRQM